MRAWIEVPASDGGDTATVLLDVDDFTQLGNRCISIGSHGYAQMWNSPGVILLHRWLMGVPAGTKYTAIVDHINRDPLDCRRANLRVVTPTESNLNRFVRGRELPLGVYRSRSGRYVARHKRFRYAHYLGTYDTPVEAALAVAEARRATDSGLFAA